MNDHYNSMMEILDLMEAEGILEDWLEEMAENAENERLYEKGYGAL